MALIEAKDAARVIDLTARVKRLTEVLAYIDAGKGRIGAVSMRMEIYREGRAYGADAQEYKIDTTDLKPVIFGYIRRAYQLALDECNRELRRIGVL